MPFNESLYKKIDGDMVSWSEEGRKLKGFPQTYATAADMEWYGNGAQIVMKRIPWYNTVRILFSAKFFCFQVFKVYKCIEMKELKVR